MSFVLSRPFVTNSILLSEKSVKELSVSPYFTFCPCWEPNDFSAGYGSRLAGGYDLLPKWDTWVRALNSSIPAHADLRRQKMKAQVIVPLLPWGLNSHLPAWPAYCRHWGSSSADGSSPSPKHKKVKKAERKQANLLLASDPPWLWFLEHMLNLFIPT